MYNQENFSFEIHAEKIIVFVVKITPKDGLISKSILTSVPLPKRGAKSGPWEESLNKLFTAKGRKFQLSAKGRYLTLFFIGNETKVKIHTILD